MTMKQPTINNLSAISDKFLTALYEHTSLSDREKDYLLAIMEMTEEEKEQLEKFKKRYQATLDKDGNGEITLNGERIKVIGSKEPDFFASTKPITGNFRLNIENLCKLSDPKDCDAILQHEFGHRKLHTIDIDGNVVDKKILDDKLRNDIVKDILTSYGIDPENPANGKERQIIREFNNYLKVPMSPDMIKNLDHKRLALRKKFRSDIQRYAVKGSMHLNRNEFEADQYAANKVGKDAVIHSLKLMDSLDKELNDKNTEAQLEEFKKTKKYNNASNQEKRKLLSNVKKYLDYSSKDSRIIHEGETEIRKSVLNDTSISNAKKRSLTE